MKKNSAEDELRRRRERLEAMSKEEWHDAVKSFWAWFEKVRSWQQARDERATRRTGPSRS